ncbi:MAG: ABC transporter ATP-binding protein [Firmicutes bacterium]|jgi:putative ABC transport system ATP-binding protein|uniref:Macrolide ABC transporter ATP-binding protein n=1 Tax=Sulfobacillus benefaciens TaxID=453960 RepID=A0A2T2X9F7_9FIRM|nr:ABC transporter ATP-binding protein [Bacillota bacterium]MCL5013158.1 ABC transporter ATP-binding protein [Bacillota bacterium]PSR31151.1 MAG: macrolide ABC transporter ATP-binding protein [Sulfobacillus benefaciens]
MIQITNVIKDYTLASQVYRVLNGITFTIPEGMLAAIVGPSGSGKTTLLNILGGLDSPTAGEYLLNGRDVSHFDPDEWAHERNHTIGFVFQSFQLIPSLSARDNVALPLVYRGVPARIRRIQADEGLERVGLGHRKHHRPAQLSGGQQQRVAIARALVGDPPVLLADEPTGNLDHATGLEILEILRQLSEQGKTVVIVTHSAEVAQVCRQVIEVQDGHIVTNTLEMEQKV